MTYRWLLIFGFVAACSSQTKESPKPSGDMAKPQPVKRAQDPMSVALRWANTKDQQVLRLVRISDSEYQAVVAPSDGAEFQATLLTIRLDESWKVTETTDAKGDAFWPTL